MSDGFEQGLSPGAALRASPVTAAWLLLALVCLPISLQLTQATAPLLRLLFMVDPGAAGQTPIDALIQGLAQGQVWRLVSPAFLHFSVLHIAFNSVLFFILGQGLEARFGSPLVFFLLLVWAGFSNLAQFLYGGSILFGGLSGVVMAQFGARLVLGWLRPDDLQLRLHPALILSLGLSLVVFSTGLSALFGLKVANTAHWAGFFSGAVSGGLLHLFLSSGVSGSSGRKN